MSTFRSEQPTLSCDWGRDAARCAGARPLGLGCCRCLGLWCLETGWSVHSPTCEGHCLHGGSREGPWECEVLWVSAQAWG